MEPIESLARFLQTVIPIAGAARIVYCLAVMSAAEDAAASYKKRIRNILVFIACSECVTEIFRMIAGYYGG